MGSFPETTIDSEFLGVLLSAFYTVCEANQIDSARELSGFTRYFKP